MRRRNAPRLNGFPYIGYYRYFLTICTKNRTTVFVTHDVVQSMTLQLLRSADIEGFAVIAYCFMPDHVHALIEGLRTDADMRGFVHRWKQQSAHEWKQKTGTVLWQRGYHEHTLRQDEDAFAIARYLLANPLRAGLVENILDYPFIGSQTMSVADLIYSVQQGRP